MKSVIIGAGKYGEVYLAYLQEAGVDVVGFLDDAPNLQGTTVRGVPVLGRFDALESLAPRYGVEAVYCPLGDCRLRVKILKEAQRLGYQAPNFIHPLVEVSPHVELADRGVYILPRTVLMPYSRIGAYVMMSCNSLVSHHTTVGEGTFLSFGVNLGASIRVDKYVYIGIGATIMTGVHGLGEDCLIGAGAVVIRDVPAGAVMAGVPAKVLKYK